MPKTTMMLRYNPCKPRRVQRRARGLVNASKRQPDLEHIDRVERKFSLQAALDIRRLAEAVLFARKQEIADRVALAPQHLHHGFGLIRRNDLVFVALKEDDRLLQSLGMKERRALAVARLLLRIRADQPVEITRLEFMGVARQRRGVADAIMAGASLKEIAKHQGGKRRIAAGAATCDDRALVVHQSLGREMFGAIDAIIDVDNAPVVIEP